MCKCCLPLCKVRSKVTGVTYERRQVGIRNARRKASWPVMTYKGVTEDVLQWWCFYLTPFLRHQRSWCRTGRGGGCLGEGAKKKDRQQEGRWRLHFGLDCITPHLLQPLIFSLAFNLIHFSQIFVLAISFLQPSTPYLLLISPE